MFVGRLQKDKPKFIDAMVKLQQQGKLLPDSYAVDMEQFRANGAAIAASAKEKGIKLYFMLKRIGRNPVLARELVKLGFDGAVIVDFKEAQVMADHGNDPNIGHNKHTRENVPLLVYRKGLEGVKLGLRKSLSDVGATVCDFFGVKAPQNGESFLKLLK